MKQLITKFLDSWNKLIKKEMTSFHFPFKRKYRISSPYGWRTHPITKKRQFHNGIDIAAPSSTYVYPTAMGEVIHIEYQKNLSGKFIRIKHANGMVSTYAHLQIKVYVEVGDILGRNTVIGKCGNTGRSTGAHLHFGIFTNLKKRKTIDPETILSNDF